MQSYPKHYCGVFGVYGHPNAAELTYYGLYALQHRGQESAGIVTSDGRHFRRHKGMGLVSQVFNGEIPARTCGVDLHRAHALFHHGFVTDHQCPTADSRLRAGSDCDRAQRQSTNAAHLREELESRGSIFQTTVDSEIILHLMAQPRVNGDANNLVHSIRRIEGAYSLVIMTEKELIGVRDPFGFRPLASARLVMPGSCPARPAHWISFTPNSCATWNRARSW